MTPEAFIAFARSLPEPMALTDERGRVVASNAAARDFVVPLRTGVSVCDLSPDGPRLREWLAACRDARGLLKTTVPLRRDDGTLVDVRIEAASLAEGDTGDDAGRAAAALPLPRLGGAGAGAAHRRSALPRAVLERRARHLPLPRRRRHPRRQPGARRHARPRVARVARRREAGRHLRGTRRVPDARRSHPPRGPGPQRRRQLAPAQRRSARRSGSRAASRRAAARTASSSCWSRTPPSVGRSRRSSRTPPRWSRSAASPAASRTTSTTC